MLPPTYVEGFHDLEAVKAMEYQPLGKTGLLVSKLSLGGGPFGCHYGAYNEEEAIEVVRQGIKRGINYIDTGPWYGQGRSETLIGKVMNNFPRENHLSLIPIWRLPCFTNPRVSLQIATTIHIYNLSLNVIALKGIPRQAYYIATKVGRYELNYEDMFDFSQEKTRKSIKNSLNRLGLDYVDVIQVHDIEFAPGLDIVITQTLPELSRQVADGNAKFIGVTGYPVSILKECIEKSNINISCILSYTRLTLIDDTLMEYIPFFKANNIGIINASSPCMGLLTNNGPPDWHPSSEQTKKLCADAGKHCKDHDVELAKLAICYGLQCTDVSTCLVGIQTLEQLKMSFDVLLNGITEKEKILLAEIQDKYLSKISEKHWDGKEVRMYWEHMKK